LGNPGLKINKKHDERSHYVIENKRWQYETKLRMKPKRAQIECEMRALNAQLEFFDAARIPADGRPGGMRQGSGRAGRGRARKYKNRGNEAKKYLKTKEVTILNAANCAHFGRQIAPIEC